VSYFLWYMQPVKVNRSFGEIFRLHLHALLACSFILASFLAPKRRLTFKGLYIIIFQKVQLLITAAVSTSGSFKRNFLGNGFVHTVACRPVVNDSVNNAHC
jgi:hypothetical protein